MSTISSFNDVENKYDVYSGKDCLIALHALIEHAMKITK